ncbi:hypothetical protein TWF718_001538 [Orbilia javanica]|uniref:Uncharacterized protein n=1 Tax=Orbilia javanica TaxID=47235 RepID=A0AAN8NHW1_9PEZI
MSNQEQQALLGWQGQRTQIGTSGDQGSSSERRQQPPLIKKPKQAKQNLTYRILQDAFDVDYYNSKTEGWEHIKMAAAIKVLKNCCEQPIQNYLSEFEPQIKRFSDQSERLKIKIYNEFIQNLKTTELKNETFREVLFDMLESTREKRWLFVWLVGQIVKNWQRKDPGSPPEGSTAPMKRRDPLGINELINHENLD